MPSHSPRTSATLTILALGLAACGGYGSTSQSGGTVHTESMASGVSADGAAPAVRTVGGGVGAPTSAPARGPAGGGGHAEAEMAPAAEPAPAPSADAAAAPGAPTGGDGAAAEVRTTTTTTTTTTVTVGESPAPEPQYRPSARLLTAASVGDVDRRGNYRDYLRRRSYEGQRLGLDMTRRVRIRVLDAQGRPVHDARLHVHGGAVSVKGRTHADGYWDFFPGVSAPGARGSLHLDVAAGQVHGETTIHVPSHGDGQQVTVRMQGLASATQPVLDLAFLIDSTGSMGDELRYVNAEVADIVHRIRSEVPEVRVRVGAVFYRDRMDSTPLQRIRFTSDVAGFARAMRSVHATGGGDYPEDLNSGLETAMHGLEWSQGEAVRALVVIGDAPPQRYATNFDYASAMREASERGIRILPVAASGANREVEFLFRAMGAFTSTPYVYLTDDSGIGNPHMEADTDRVAVEYFNDLLTRMIVADLRGDGMHEPGAFGPGGQM